ncbi:MAG TPA: alpha-isopropylmalate synthase regulatory domain-containing protein [Spirochaetia bacterium]|nr:alpha-isopropylmalate synthase regulatory domain-containing protein [Spirochaetia bacterium]
MVRRIEVFDTTLRDGNKLPFVVLSPDDRVQLARQLARLGVDVIEAGWPAASHEEADCVSRVCDEIEGPYVAALARALPGDVDAALTALAQARRPYIHIYMGVSPHFLRHMLKISDEKALKDISDCVRTAKSAGVKVQFSLSEAPHARHDFLRAACEAARDAGADVINLADTNGILAPEDVSAMVKDLGSLLGEGASTAIGMHCHDDLGLAAANTLAAVLAGASHVEVTIGGFGERAGNAALEEVAFLITAFGQRYGISHGVKLDEIARTSRLFDSLTGIRTHPNKPIIGRCAFQPAPGGFSGKSLTPDMRKLMRDATIGRQPEDEALVLPVQEHKGLYELESFNVMTASHSPPVGVVVITRGGKRLTQTSHGDGPVDALLRAVDKALGFSTRMVLYSVSTIGTGTDAMAEVIVTVELRGRRFHGRHRSTDVIEASLRAYMNACNAIGESGILEGPSDFHVAGEYLWE